MIYVPTHNDRRKFTHNTVGTQHRLSYYVAFRAIGGDAQRFARQCHKQPAFEYTATKTQHARGNTNTGILEVRI